MARDQQPEEQRTRKSVRFNECPGPAPSGLSVGMVQSLVSQLPGLDPESLYVISGPFPQQNQNTDTSNMVIMATPVPAGVTVVAVPSGPLPTKGPKGTLTGHFPHVSRCPPSNPLAGPAPTPAPGPAPVPFHLQQQTQPRPDAGQPPAMMHWDMAHPAGQPIPLRQPLPPVYYNVSPPADNTPSGSQSPSSMSCSDLSSEDSGSNHENQGLYPCPGQYQFPHHQQYPAQYLPGCHQQFHAAFPANNFPHIQHQQQPIYCQQPQWRQQPATY